MSVGVIFTRQAHRANAVHPARVGGARLGKGLEGLQRGVQILLAKGRPRLLTERGRLLVTEVFYS
ncbi:hypothetical protein WIW49_13690 [Xanthomonas euroxanthea]